MLSESVSWWSLILSTERADTQIDDWHATLVQCFDAGETSQPLGDITALYFGITSFELQAHTCKLCQRNYTHILHVMASLAFAACSGPHPVKCRTSRCTTVQHYITVSCVHKCKKGTPDHTQLWCWVWSVAQQTWTFQPIEVRATILTPYMIWSGVVHWRSRRHLYSTKVPEVNNSPTCWDSQTDQSSHLSVINFLTMQTHA